MNNTNPSLPLNATIKIEQTENEKLLISLVRPEEYLYNRYHPYYRNHTAKHAKWIEIASNLNSTPKDCKAKWKALRDQYARELKRLARTYKDDAVRWKHYNDLDFLKKFITTRVELTATAAAAGHIKKEKKSLEKQLKTEPIFVSVENNDIVDEELIDEQQQQQHQQNESQQEEEHWEFLDSTTATDFNEQTFDNSTLVQAAEQSQVTATEIVVHQQQQQHHQLQQQQQQQQQQNLTPSSQQQQPHQQQEEEEDDSIHTFLKIEGYFEKQLISLVKIEECLYNRRHPQYRNYDVKNQKWEEIANKLKTTVKQARLKWKALRDQYTREFKRLKRKSLLHPIKIEDTSRWRHYDALCYLEEFIRERKFQSEPEYKNEQQNDTTMDIDYIIEHDEVLNDFDDKQIHNIQTADGTHLKISTIKMEQLNNNNSSNNNSNINIGGNNSNNNNNCHTPTTSSVQTAEEDEVDAFFKAISMKVRHAKLSPVVFTDLQIEILRVINTKFRNFSDTF